MLDLKLGEWRRIHLYDKIQKKTKKEMIKLLEDCGFVRALYTSYGGKDDNWTVPAVPALLDYSAPIEIGTKYIYIARVFDIFPNKIYDENNPKYGQVTIAKERNGWKPGEWDIAGYDKERENLRQLTKIFFVDMQRD